MRLFHWIFLVQLLAMAAAGQDYSNDAIFQFEAFYYQTPLEICPGDIMTLSGPVQGNADVYLDPEAQVVFQSLITSAGAVYLSENPLDPSERIFGSVSFAQPPVTNIVPYALPGDPAMTNGYGLLQLPGPGALRLYDLVDMIIVVSNDNSILVSSGVAVDNQRTIIAPNQWQLFVSTNGHFL